MKLLDTSDGEVIVLGIVQQSTKTHYLGGAVAPGTGYYMRYDSILSSGGNGISTISFESPLGREHRSCCHYSRD